MMRVFVLVSIALAACAAPRPEPPAAGVAPVPVRTARVELTDVAAPIEAGGVVRARLTAPVAARVLAPILDVRVRAGDRVHRGDVLIVLDGREAAANRARAQAALAASEQAVTAADAGHRAADAALVLARATFGRIDALHAKRSATAQELDEASAALRGAEAHAAGAQAMVAEARAGLDASRAASEAAAVGASYTTLTAAFDGTVTERLADPGTMAAPGAPLLTLEDTGGYRLEVRLDESRVGAVRPGDSAGVRIDTLSDAVTSGRVAEIARLDPMAHSFLVKIDLPPAPALRSGLFGTARFAGPSRRVLAVPASAIVARGQLTFAYALDGDGTARLRPVSTAPAVGDRAEVLAGLQAGDQVVLAPPPALADGTRTRAGALR